MALEIMPPLPQPFAVANALETPHGGRLTVLARYADPKAPRFNVATYNLAGVPMGARECAQRAYAGDEGALRRAVESALLDALARPVATVKGFPGIRR